MDLFELGGQLSIADGFVFLVSFYNLFAILTFCIPFLPVCEAERLKTFSTQLYTPPPWPPAVVTWRETGWGQGDSVYPRRWQPVIIRIKGF